MSEKERDREKAGKGGKGREREGKGRKERERERERESRLIGQAGGYADMERHVPELYDWVQKNNEAVFEMRCAILDVVSRFPGVLQQLWTDVSVRCPRAESHNESASKPVAGVAGEA